MTGTTGTRGCNLPRSAIGIVEVKSGRLNDLTELIDQMIRYPLLAHHDGHPMTHVAAYAIHYQRLLRFPTEPLLNRLAGPT